MRNLIYLLILMTCVLTMCTTPDTQQDKIQVLFDTDANNELDDQHAIAYLLMSGDIFDVVGLTVNRTRNGGDVIYHQREAERVVKLCGVEDRIEVTKGANGNFEEILPTITENDFDGYEAVDLVIEKAHKERDEKLLLLPVGKLTNIALALAKDPTIIPKVKIVWLGSNYPDRGEYNQNNDEGALNYILNTTVDFEIALVRGGKPSGTWAVTASLDEIKQKMPGLGPVSEPVIGRHGGEFTTFGDYSVNLFEHIDHYGENQTRSLFDMAAVAIVKNPDWAETDTIPAPILVDSEWQDRPDNKRKVVLWENFDKNAIMADFYHTMENYTLVE